MKCFQSWEHFTLFFYALKLHKTACVGFLCPVAIFLFNIVKVLLFQGIGAISKGNVLIRTRQEKFLKVTG